jgi:hypothetical protein
MRAKFLILAGLAAFVIRPASAAAQCRTNADTAAAVVGMIETHLSSADSTDLVSMGLPYKPSSVTIVSTASVCTSVINSFNALYPNSQKSRRISSAFIVKADNSYALYRPPRAGKLDTYFFFNSTFQYKTSATALQ